jgi:mannitol/fructose-specific phosphotransferase system IIA component (Ntr-type)
MRSILTALQEGRLFELPDTEKVSCLEFLARILDANPDLAVDTDSIEEILRREQECNTGIGLGVAVPHIRAGRVDGELFCAIGWSQHGIDYGAADGEQVHLVFMYYIPIEQKNVYLKEISILVKAIKKSGGIAPIEHAEDLNEVRHLLLDWVSAGLDATGPDAVARMIKLEVKQAQAVAETETAATHAPARAAVFSVLVAPPGTPVVLAQNAVFATALEKHEGLVNCLAGGVPFTAAGRQIFVTSSTEYPGGRLFHQCVAVTPAR